MRAARRLPARGILPFVAALGLAGAGPSPPAVVQKLPAAHGSPLLTRASPNPIEAVRSLAALQDRIAQGVPEALADRADKLREVGRRLASFGAAVWDDARHRESAVKYVLSGGDPRLLEALLAGGKFAPDERSLAEGALAYARGRREEAAELFGKVDPRLLPSSLGGHVSLVIAALAGESDPLRALEACDEARLLSPGTLVEEAALRLSVELAIAAGDRGRLERAVLRHFRRFPRSLYAGTIDPRIVRVIVTGPPDSTEEGARIFEAIGSELPAERRGALLTGIAEGALRTGNISMATDAARRAREAAPARSPALSASRAIEGAAMVLGPERRKALQSLAEVEAAGPGDEVRELIFAARALAALIEAPPGRAQSASKATPSHPSAANVEALASRAQARLGEVEKLIAEAGS